MVRGAVESVADDGMAEGLKVDADLVGAAGLDANFDQRKGPVGGGDAFEDLDVRDGVTDAFGVGGAAGGHASAAHEVATDREVDGDVVLGEAAVNEGDVGLFELATREHLAELAVGAVVLGDDDDAAGLLVEAVDDSGAEFAAEVRELVEVMQQRVDEGSAVALVSFPGSGGSRAGVNHQSGGLVDDGEVLVLVEDGERDVLGEGVEWRWVRGAFDLDRFPALQLEFCFRWLSIDADLTVFDEELDACAGDIGYGLSEVLIEAEALNFILGGELNGLRTGRRR